MGRLHPIFGVRPPLVGAAGLAKRLSSLGKHGIWVPAAAMRPTVSNGCASLVDVETTSGRPDLHVLDFDLPQDSLDRFGNLADRYLFGAVQVIGTVLGLRLESQYIPFGQVFNVYKLTKLGAVPGYDYRFMGQPLVYEGSYDCAFAGPRAKGNTIPEDGRF